MFFLEKQRQHPCHWCCAVASARHAVFAGCARTTLHAQATARLPCPPTKCLEALHIAAATQPRFMTTSAQPQALADGVLRFVAAAAAGPSPSGCLRGGNTCGAIAAKRGAVANQCGTGASRSGAPARARSGARGAAGAAIAGSLRRAARGQARAETEARGT